MPNWNSCTMPVTTPMAKLIRNRRRQKRVMRSHLSCLSASLTGPVGGRLHDRQQQGEADRERDEHEVEDGRDPELPARKIKRHCNDESRRGTLCVRAEGPVAAAARRRFRRPRPSCDDAAAGPGPAAAGRRWPRARAALVTWARIP